MTPTTCTTTTSSVTPVTRARAEVVSSGCLGKSSYTLFNDQIQSPVGGLPEEMIQPIFMQCLASGDIKGFMTLGLTNALGLEPFVEDRKGLTIIFNQGGLTLKDMKENNCGIIVNVLCPGISEELDDLPEEDTGAEMISNAPITETRDESDAIQEIRLRVEVGFDGKPTLIQYLALMIATQKELKISLYNEEPKTTYGRSSTYVEGCSLTVGCYEPGTSPLTTKAWTMRSSALVGD